MSVFVFYKSRNLSINYATKLIWEIFTIALIALVVAIAWWRSIFLISQRLKKSNQELELLVQQKSNELEALKSSLQRTNFLLDRRENQLRKQQNILFALTKDRAINQGCFLS